MSTGEMNKQSEKYPQGLIVQAQYSGQHKYNLAQGQPTQVFRVDRVDGNSFFMFCLAMDDYNVQRMMNDCKFTPTHVYIGTGITKAYIGAIDRGWGWTAKEWYIVLDKPE